jgi:hypothetical protein
LSKPGIEEAPSPLLQRKKNVSAHVGYWVHIAILRKVRRPHRPEWDRKKGVEFTTPSGITAIDRRFCTQYLKGILFGRRNSSDWRCWDVCMPWNADRLFSSIPLLEGGRPVSDAAQMFYSIFIGR